MKMMEYAGPALLVTGAGIYYYFYIRRIANLLGLRTDLREIRLGIAGLSGVLVAPAYNIWGIWAVVVLHHFAFALVFELVNLGVRRGRGQRGWRILYSSGLLPLLCTGLVLLYGYWNMNHIVRTEYTVYTKKEIREEGYRLCLVSDLHYGDVLGEERLLECCQEISRSRPDFLVLCGDIVDEHTTKEELEEVFEALSGVRTEYGIYYVYGNHDRGRYGEEVDFTEEELERTIRDKGIRILRDETVTVNGELTLLGRDDRTHPEQGGRMASRELIRQADPDHFLLLLDHQPRELKENAALGYDLQLSGHTHGGQIWPVGKISGLLGFGEMNYGHQRIGDFQVIVSSGMAGWAYPIRTGKHSEYVMVDLCPEK